MHIDTEKILTRSHLPDKRLGNFVARTEINMTVAKSSGIVVIEAGEIEVDNDDKYICKKPTKDTGLFQLNFIVKLRRS